MKPPVREAAMRRPTRSSFFRRLWVDDRGLADVSSGQLLSAACVFMIGVTTIPGLGRAASTVRRFICTQVANDERGADSPGGACSDNSSGGAEVDSIPGAK